jgi:hypothetical protein
VGRSKKVRAHLCGVNSRLVAYSEKCRSLSRNALWEAWNERPHPYAARSAYSQTAHVTVVHACPEPSVPPMRLLLPPFAGSTNRQVVAGKKDGWGGGDRKHYRAEFQGLGRNAGER